MSAVAYQMFSQHQEGAGFVFVSNSLRPLAGSAGTNPKLLFQKHSDYSDSTIFQQDTFLTIEHSNRLLEHFLTHVKL